jgi:hypothetical protein
MLLTENINKWSHVNSNTMAVDKRKVIAFDIGIKNLAFCILEHQKEVLALENCNLLEPVEHVTCRTCTAKASLQAGTHPCCKRHLPIGYTILPELLKKKLPSVTILRQLVKDHQCEQLGNTKEKCLESLAKKFALPLEQPKQANASKVSLEVIHDALRQFVQEKAPLLDGCTHVLLENQPAFKNPHMKSVQVLLFAVLREAFLTHGETPKYHFVHAKKKVANAPKGDVGYAERKNQSEARLMELFDSGQIQGAEWYTAWKAAKKKSDMADALCMTVDLVE